MAFVLDACARIAFARDEPGADVIEDILTNEQCVAHALNMCEMYYDFFRAANQQAAESVVADLLALGLTIR